MNALTIAKLALGSIVVSGGGLTGTYFGTSKTIKQHLKTSKQLEFPPKTEDYWNENLSTLKSKNDLKSKEFEDFKTENQEKSDGQELRTFCERILKWNYSSFGITNVEGKLIEDMENFCFKRAS